MRTSRRHPFSVPQMAVVQTLRMRDRLPHNDPGNGVRMTQRGRAGTGRRAASLDALLADAERCAEGAGLTYVDCAEPGISRRRCGRGFSYLDARGRAVGAATRQRIVALAIPPAWRDVWICSDPAGHLLATGHDDRGRTQYLYHDRWREFRDLVNFYRLTEVGRALPRIRADIGEQLRRRTLDRSRAIAAMLRIVDVAGVRIGNETYAEENDSVGVCTLRKRHAQVRGRRVELRFPAKSGRRAEVDIDDAHVAEVVRRLLDEPGQRLFRVDAKVISAGEINDRLAALSSGVMTAKDFRTWRGTLVAFRSLRASHDWTADDGARERDVIDAVDAAADALGNTRSVARAHYVHPHVLETYLDGTFAQRLAASRPSRAGRRS